MSNKDLLDNIKKLREMTGVGFKDCKFALDESNGDIEKSIEFLRKKGIAKASKKMSRTASEGLALVKEENGQISIIDTSPLSSLTNANPSEAVLLIFLEALAIPFFLKNSIDFSISPLVSSKAILQSLKPTPVISLSFFILSNKSLFDI